jgi:putative addiction module CopG family antidote
MEHLSVRLSAQLHKKIKSSVKQGLFINQSELVRDAIRRLLETEAKKSNSGTEVQS